MLTGKADDMDVRILMAAIAVSFTFIGCDNNERPTGQASFNKPDVDSECEDQRIDGQYLVKWKNGTYTVETSKDDSAFVRDFFSKKKSQLISAEPHFHISVASPNDLKTTGFGGEDNWGIDNISAQAVWAVSYTHLTLPTKA